MPNGWRCLLLCCVAIGVALCTPILESARYTLEDSHRIPDDWISEGPAPSQHIIKLHIGLRTHRFETLERHLYEGMSPQREAVQGSPSAESLNLTRL